MGGESGSETAKVLNGVLSSVSRRERQEHRETPLHLLKFAHYSSENQLKLLIVL
jgi:hypothetical protein